jgi:hypothetical protein
MYGADAGLEVSAGAERGVRVRIRVPYRIARPADMARPSA